jgi:PAS domain S-box-containing protein
VSQQFIVSITEEDEAVRAWLAKMPAGVRVQPLQAPPEDLLSRAASLAKLAAWELDPTSGTLYWSPQIKEIYGLTYNGILADVEGAQKTQEGLELYDTITQKAISEAMQELMQAHKPFVLDGMLTAKDGETKHVRVKGDVVKDADGKVLSYYGTVRDISEEMRLKQAKEAAEQNLRALLNATTQTYVLVGPDCTLLSFNDAASNYTMRFVGKRLRIGDNLLDYGDPDANEAFVAIIAKVMDGEKVTSERELVLPIGNRWLLTQYLPAINDYGEVYAVAIVQEDITDRKLQEQAQANELIRVRQTLEHLPLGAIMIQEDRISMNLMAEQLTGFHRDEIPELKDLTQKMGAIWETVTKFFARPRFTSTSQKNLSLHINKRNGERRLFAFTGSTVMPGVNVMLFQDITDEFEAKQKLMESEARFRSLADCAPVLIWMSDPDKACVYFNKTWLNFTGKTHEEEYGYGWANGVHPDDYDRCVRIYEQNFDRRSAFEMTYRLRHHTGEYRWIQDNGAPRYLPDGTFAGYIGTCTDIHELVTQREELRRLSMVVEKTRNLVVLADADGRITWVNDAFMRKTGYNLSEIKGKTPGSILQGPETNPAHKAALGEAIRLQKTVSQSILNYNKDGVPYWLQVEITPIFEEGQLQQYIAVETDITELVHTREQLEKSLQEARFFKDALDAAALIMITDHNRVIRYVNDRLCEFAKLDRAQLVGVPFEVADNSQNGGSFWIEHAEILREDKIWHGIIANRWADGAPFWLDTTVVPFKDKDGKVQQILFISYDVTDRMLMEAALEAKEQAMMQAVVNAQDEERKRIAAELHDSLGMLLSAARMNLQATQDKLAKLDVAEPESLQIAMQLVDQSVADARSISHNLQPQHLAIQGLSESIRTLARNINQSNKLYVIALLNENLDSLSLDMQHSLFRILQELLGNAVKHAEASEVVISGGATKGKVRLVVEDNGKGLPTTDQGMGMGLSNVTFRVKAMGGELISESEPGKFTRFILSIPIS